MFPSWSLPKLLKFVFCPIAAWGVFQQLHHIPPYCSNSRTLLTTCLLDPFSAREGSSEPMESWRTSLTLPAFPPPHMETKFYEISLEPSPLLSSYDYLLCLLFQFSYRFFSTLILVHDSPADTLSLFYTLELKNF